MFQFNRSEGLLLLKFPAGFERQFEKHVELVGHLRQANVYPRVDLAAYVATSPSAALSRFIVLTGSSSEIARIDRVFYEPAAEAFVATRCANNWDAISPQASISNVAAPGCMVDVDGLERDLRAIEQEIAAGLYERAPVDSTEGTASWDS